MITNEKGARMISEWRPLKIKQFSELAKASDTMHHAGQYVALAGRYLLPEKEDDSHTAMKWLPGKNWLTGRVIRFPDDYIHLALDYNTFSLLLVDEDLKVLQQNQLDGCTKEEILNWLRITLSEYGFDAGRIKGEMNYDLPPHPTDEGHEFKQPKLELMAELATYRTNGHLLITHFATEFNSAQPVYIWPHHFDEACYVPLLFNEGEVIGSISFGLSVPDEFYSTPYLYVTAWKKEGVDYAKPPVIDKPGLWHSKGWNGQILQISELVGLPGEEQSETALNFMKQAINNARGLVGWIYT